MNNVTNFVFHRALSVELSAMSEGHDLNDDHQFMLIRKNAAIGRKRRRPRMALEHLRKVGGCSSLLPA